MYERGRLQGVGRRLTPQMNTRYTAEFTVDQRHESVAGLIATQSQLVEYPRYVARCRVQDASLIVCVIEPQF